MADATPSGGNGVDPEKEQQAEQSAKRILEEGAASDAPAMPEALQFLTEKLQLQEIELKRDFAKQDIKLKEKYAEQEIGLRRAYGMALLAILAVQLAAANVVFWVFAEVGNHWHLSDGVVQIWLAATVVQVVGVVTVVTRYLFPRRDTQPEPPSLPKASS